jgi:hypothetical protein
MLEPHVPTRLLTEFLREMIFTQMPPEDKRVGDPWTVSQVQRIFNDIPDFNPYGTLVGSSVADSIVTTMARRSGLQRDDFWNVKNKWDKIAEDNRYRPLDVVYEVKKEKVEKDLKNEIVQKLGEEGYADTEVFWDEKKGEYIVKARKIEKKGDENKSKNERIDWNEYETFEWPRVILGDQILVRMKDKVLGEEIVISRQSGFNANKKDVFAKTQKGELYQVQEVNVAVDHSTNSYFIGRAGLIESKKFEDGKTISSDVYRCGQGENIVSLDVVGGEPVYVVNNPSEQDWKVYRGIELFAQKTKSDKKFGNAFSLGGDNVVFTTITIEDKQTLWQALRMSNPPTFDMDSCVEVQPFGNNDFVAVGELDNKVVLYTKLLNVTINDAEKIGSISKMVISSTGIITLVGDNGSCYCDFDSLDGSRDNFEYVPENIDEFIVDFPNVGKLGVGVSNEPPNYKIHYGTSDANGEVFISEEDYEYLSSEVVENTPFVILKIKKGFGDTVGSYRIARLDLGNKGSSDVLKEPMLTFDNVPQVINQSDRIIFAGHQDGKFKTYEWMKKEEVAPVKEKSLDEEKLKRENDPFITKKLKDWYTLDDGDVPTLHLLTQAVKDIRFRNIGVTKQLSRFGMYTLNPETQNINWDNVSEDQIFLPDLTSFQGKPAYEVLQRIVDLYSETHYIPGIEYWRWLKDNYDKAPDSLKDQSAKFYFAGSLIGDTDGFMDVPYSTRLGESFSSRAQVLNGPWPASGLVVLVRKDKWAEPVDTKKQEEDKDGEEVILDHESMLGALKNNSGAVMTNLIFLKYFKKPVVDDIKMWLTVDRGRPDWKQRASDVFSRTPLVGKMFSHMLRTNPEEFLDSMTAVQDRTDRIYLDNLLNKLDPILKNARKQKPSLRSLLNQTLGRNSEQSVDYLREKQSTEVWGGDPEKGHDQELFRVNDESGEMYATGVFLGAKEVGASKGKFNKVSVEIDESVDGTTSEITGTIALSQQVSGSLIIPKRIGARIISDRVKIVMEDGTEQKVGVRKNEYGEDIVDINFRKGMKSLVWSQEVPDVPYLPSDIAEREYAKVRGESNKDLPRLSPEDEYFLKSIENKSPKERLYAIEEYAQSVSYYDFKNGEVKDEKRGLSPEERISFMEIRCKELAKNNEALRASGKRYAGVCADFSIFTTLLMLKSGLNAGVASGAVPENGVATMAHAHSLSVALWPERAGNRLVSIDGTPTIGLDENETKQLRMIRFETLREREEKGKVAVRIEHEKAMRMLDEIDAVLGDSKEAIARIQNGDLERMLNTVLKYEVKEVHTKVITRLFESSRYGGLPVFSEELGDKVQVQKFIDGEIRSERSKNSSEVDEKIGLAGTTLFDTFREYVDTYAKEQGGSREEGIRKIEHIIDLAEPVLGKTENRALRLITQYLKAEKMKR